MATFRHRRIRQGLFVTLRELRRAIAVPPRLRGLLALAYRRARARRRAEPQQYLDFEDLGEELGDDTIEEALARPIGRQP